MIRALGKRLSHCSDYSKGEGRGREGKRKKGEQEQEKEEEVKNGVDDHHDCNDDGEVGDNDQSSW